MGAFYQIVHSTQSKVRGDPGLNIRKGNSRQARKGRSDSGIFPC